MLDCSLILAFVTLTVSKTHAADERTTYNAAVVEYSTPLDPMLDPYTNLLNNIDNYIDFINLANDQFQTDIIVFPEIGLKGLLDQDVYLEVPDPKKGIKPCSQDTQYEVPLVQLSCVARSTATYVVVNLAEKFFNSSQQRYLYFNTDVVFDRYGAVIARYRKIHLFGESKLQSPADKELVYFDTDFGVRFGLLTCFDIIFEDPGVVLAKQFNITHFIFPAAWFSQMPFLTAIQEQYYWAYTLDVVLLASGYNLPSSGSSGTGIYMGRHGPVVYNMTETTGSFILHAQLPKQIDDGFQFSTSSRQVEMKKYTSKKGGSELNLRTYNSMLKLKRDFLDVYSTELIRVPDDAERILNGSDLLIPFNINRTICHNSLCCTFYLDISLEFGKAEETQRHDDYSRLYYRMATFDGVRHYDYVDTGGLQTCALIPCVNENLAACGLAPSDPSTKPNTLLNLNQTKFIFRSIKITGNFSNNNSFIGPNILLGGEYDNFGALLTPDRFYYTVNGSTENVTTRTLETTGHITNLVTASLYARLFFRDGKNYTGNVVPNPSAGSHLQLSISLMVAGILFTKYNNVVLLMNIVSSYVFVI